MDLDRLSGGNRKTFKSFVRVLRQKATSILFYTLVYM